MTEPRAEDTFDETFDEDSFDDDVDIEAPEADVLEQHAATRDRGGGRARRESPLEADSADAYEQDRGDDSFDDEDEYR